MIIKIDRADKTTEFFSVPNYTVSKVKDFHPLICRVTIYSENGTKISSKGRPFPNIYKNIIFKSKKVQDELKELQNVKEENNG